MSFHWGLSINHDDIERGERWLTKCPYYVLHKPYLFIKMVHREGGVGVGQKSPKKTDHMVCRCPFLVRYYLLRLIIVFLDKIKMYKFRNMVCSRMKNPKKGNLSINYFRWMNLLTIHKKDQCIIINFDIFFIFFCIVCYRFVWGHVFAFKNMETGKTWTRLVTFHKNWKLVLSIFSNDTKSQ